MSAILHRVEAAMDGDVESRRAASTGLLPLLLLAGAVGLIVVSVVVFSGHSSPPHSGPANASRRSSSDPSASSRASDVGFRVTSSTPSTGAQDVATDTTLSVTFSAPVVLGKVTPSLAPPVAGKWVRSDATTLSYDLAAPLVPGSHETLSIPGGPSGLEGNRGARLATSSSVTFDVAGGDVLRIQQLLAQLDFLPVSFTPSGQAPSRGSLAMDQAGTFKWRWPGLPPELTSLWTQGTSNEITRAAIEAFETQNGIGVDGIAGPAVWTALLNDVINHKVDATPYVYVLISKTLPENLTLWNDGTAVLAGIPVNTGAPGADTVDGSYAVFEHVRYSDMKGTNPDGTTYNDPNVPYASYFNGGDALHGFIRSSYGSPQSNGCVEMTYADAALVWPLTPIGTLVTVVGPNYGTAPPSTTTTTTPATTTTTAQPPTTTITTPPAPPPPTTTTTTTAPPPPAPTSTTTLPPTPGA
jgi:peptidoglycan hydrolase-like protein with peptidoglycan-binding domain